MPSYSRNGSRFYTTIKTQRLSENKVHIIHPSFGTLELWEVLTWPSEGILQVPHRCSLLGLLFLCCVGIVSRMWGPCDLLVILFLASSVGVVCGERRDQEISHIHHFPDKNLHGTYSFDGNRHQQSRWRTATHCPGEASSNPHSNSETPHQVES